MKRPTGIKGALQNNIRFFKLLEDPTRMRIILLLYQYSRLSLTQMSELIHLTKPAVSHQLKKFIEIGIIQMTKHPVQGSITANYYELVPDYFERTDFKLDPTVLIPTGMAKEVEILQIRGNKELYRLTRDIFSHFVKFYTKLEEKARNINEPYGIYQPPIHLQIYPLSKEAHEFYLQEMVKIEQGIVKIIKEEDKNEIVERPMMYLSTMFPIKDLLGYRDSD